MLPTRRPIFSPLLPVVSTRRRATYMPPCYCSLSRNQMRRRRPIGLRCPQPLCSARRCGTHTPSRFVLKPSRGVENGGGVISTCRPHLLHLPPPNNWGGFLAQQRWQGGVKPTRRPALTPSSLRGFSSAASKSMKGAACSLHAAPFFSP